MNKDEDQRNWPERAERGTFPGATHSDVEIAGILDAAVASQLIAMRDLGCVLKNEDRLFDANASDFKKMWSETQLAEELASHCGSGAVAGACPASADAAGDGEVAADGDGDGGGAVGGDGGGEAAGVFGCVLGPLDDASDEARGNVDEQDGVVALKATLPELHAIDLTTRDPSDAPEMPITDEYEEVDQAMRNLIDLIAVHNLVSEESDEQPPDAPGAPEQPSAAAVAPPLRPRSNQYVIYNPKDYGADGDPIEIHKRTLLAPAS